MFATQAETKKMSLQDRANVNIVRIGVAWTRAAAYWAGQAEDKICQLCNEVDEASDHVCKCSALKARQKEMDKELAEIDPDLLPAPIKHGIAPAMSLGPKEAFWADLTDKHKFNQKQRKFCRRDGGLKTDDNIKEIVDKLSGEKNITAREVMQNLLAPGPDSEDLPMPERIEGMPPMDPHVYSDGSVHNPTSMHWNIWRGGRFLAEKRDGQGPVDISRAEAYAPRTGAVGDEDVGRLREPHQQLDQV